MAGRVSWPSPFHVTQCLSLAAMESGKSGLPNAETRDPLANALATDQVALPVAAGELHEHEVAPKARTSGNRLADIVDGPLGGSSGPATNHKNHEHPLVRPEALCYPERTYTIARRAPGPA